MVQLPDGTVTLGHSYQMGQLPDVPDGTVNRCTRWDSYLRTQLGLPDTVTRKDSYIRTQYMRQLC